MPSSSLGTPGKRNRVQPPLSTRNPGAVPRSLARTAAPSTTQACRRLTSGICQPSDWNRRSRAARTSLVEVEPAAEGGGDGLAGHVVGRGTEAAGDQDEVHAGEEVAQLGGDLGFRIADHRLAPQLDAVARRAGPSASASWCPAGRCPAAPSRRREWRPSWGGMISQGLHPPAISGGASPSSATVKQAAKASANRSSSLPQIDPGQLLPFLAPRRRGGPGCRERSRSRWRRSGRARPPPASTRSSPSWRTSTAASRPERRARSGRSTGARSKRGARSQAGIGALERGPALEGLAGAAGGDRRLHLAAGSTGWPASRATSSARAKVTSMRSSGPSPARHVERSRGTSAAWPAQRPSGWLMSVTRQRGGRAEGARRSRPGRGPAPASGRARAGRRRCRS